MHLLSSEQPARPGMRSSRCSHHTSARQSPSLFSTAIEAQEIFLESPALSSWPRGNRQLVNLILLQQRKEKQHHLEAVSTMPLGLGMSGSSSSQLPAFWGVGGVRRPGTCDVTMLFEVLQTLGLGFCKGLPVKASLFGVRLPTVAVACMR